MDAIAKVAKSMYTMLEGMAVREIERDPINFILEESFVKPEKLPSTPDDNEQFRLTN